jgi:diaminopimelate epimerase
MQIHFYKYQGTGNDFIIVDNRSGIYNGITHEKIHQLCDRKFGIGADGFMFLETANEADFTMRYHNADGKEGSMCGNGGRCIVRFAYDQGIITKKDCFFSAIDGMHEAFINEDGLISLKMQDVNGIQNYKGDRILNTGSPHYIRFADDVDHLDVFSEGTKIRFSNEFAEDGINVNFVEQTSEGLRVRTYERGVEDETLSCGTGVTAAAIASSTEDGPQRVRVNVPGGELHIEFIRENATTYTDVWLTGPAVFVFNGNA